MSSKSQERLSISFIKTSTHLQNQYQHKSTKSISSKSETENPSLNVGTNLSSSFVLEPLALLKNQTRESTPNKLEMQSPRQQMIKIPSSEFKAKNSLSSSNNISLFSAKGNISPRVLRHSINLQNQQDASVSPNKNPSIIGSLEALLNPIQKFQIPSSLIPLNQTEIVACKSSGAFKNKRIPSFGNIEKKRIISRHGLEVEPICSAHKHQKLKFVCVDSNCQEKERVLCDSCIDYFGHTNHQLKTIEEYLILVESSYKQFTEKYFHAKQLREGVENPSFLGALSKQVSQFKQFLCGKLDEVRDQLIEQFKIRFGDTGPTKDTLQAEISRMEEIGNFLSEISNKNFFDLTRKELNLSLGLILRDQFVKLDDLESNITRKYLQLESLLTVTYDKFQNQLHDGIQEIFEKHKLTVPIPFNNNANIKKISEENQIRKLQELQKDIKEKRKLMKQIVSEMHQNDKKSPSKYSRQYSQIEKYFPYNTYAQSCQHMKDKNIKCNTIPIFECCQQAYQCVQCHLLFSKHTPTITNPSNRYCMRCLSLFKVDYNTDVPINCNDFQECITCLQQQITDHD